MKYLLITVALIGISLAQETFINGVTVQNNGDFEVIVLVKHDFTGSLTALTGNIPYSEHRANLPGWTLMI